MGFPEPAGEAKNLEGFAKTLPPLKSVLIIWIYKKLSTNLCQPNILLAFIEKIVRYIPRPGINIHTRFIFDAMKGEQISF